MNVTRKILRQGLVWTWTYVLTLNNLGRFVFCTIQVSAPISATKSRHSYGAQCAAYEYAAERDVKTKINGQSLSAS